MDRKRSIAIGLAAVAIWMLAGAIAPAASEHEGVKTEILETDFLTAPALWDEPAEPEAPRNWWTIPDDLDLPEPMAPPLTN